MNKKIYFNVEQIGYDGTSRVYTKPSVNSWPKPMRGAIVPSPGKKFAFFDWKGAELYLAAYWSKCTKLLDWFNSGVDPHTEIAKLLLGKTEVTKDDRALSKVCTFATIYGSEGGAVARQLNITFDEAKAIVDRYLALFPEIVQLRDTLRRYAKDTFHTKTMTGRYRKLTNLSSRDQMALDKGLRQVFNTAIQSGVADFFKKLAIKSLDYPEISYKFGVFDSFLFEIPEDMPEERFREIATELSDFSSEYPGLKFRFDLAFSGKSWLDAYNQL